MAPTPVGAVFCAKPSAAMARVRAKQSNGFCKFYCLPKELRLRARSARSRIQSHPLADVLEHELQTKLDNAWIGRSAGDHAECIGRALLQAWIHKLRMVQDIEEVRSELNGVLLRNLGGLHERSVPVDIARAENDYETGIAIECAAGRTRGCRRCCHAVRLDGGHPAKFRRINVAVGTEGAAQPRRDAAAGLDVAGGRPRAQLRPALAAFGRRGAADAISRSSVKIEERERTTILD